MTLDPYKDEVTALRARLNAVIRSKWPETLMDDATRYAWARENLAELMVKHDRQEAEIEALWQNRCPLEQFKAAVLEWGRTILELFKSYAGHLQKEAA